MRELDESLGLSELMDRHLSDSRRGKNTNCRWLTCCGSRLTAGWRVTKMLTTPRASLGIPTFRLIGSRKTWERGAASTSRLQSFETEVLTQEDNFAGLAVLNRELLARAEGIDSPRRVVLDMDSTEVRVHGQQEESAYNGHFESTCYHPLLLFNREGDCLAAKLRPGNVHSADGWEELLLPEIERQQAQGKEVTFRGDAAFAKPEGSTRCSKNGTCSTRSAFLPITICRGRLRSLLRGQWDGRATSRCFDSRAFPIRRPVGTDAASGGEGRVPLRGLVPPRRLHRDQSWDFKPAGGAVLQQARYGRTWIKEGKQAVKMTRLSCHRFRANEVRLWLSVIAYNLGNLWRRLALPAPIGTWSLTSLQQRLVKTGGRLINMPATTGCCWRRVI